MVELEENFAKLQRLFNNLIFENIDNSDVMTVVLPFSERRLLKCNKVENVYK